MNQKKTKIVCTISDINCEVDFIRDLYERGLNVVRMNTAHANDEGIHQLIQNVRTVSENIPLLIDTKGPEIRTTVFPEDYQEKFVIFEPGDRVYMVGNPEGVTTHDCISMNYANFCHDVPVGATVLIDDGEIAFEVVDREGDALIAEALNHGELGQRKSVNVPGVSIKLPSLTDKDRHMIELAIKEDIDFIAHSFVRSKQDVLDIQEILDAHGSKIKIIAKIENQEGVDNIDEILDVAFGVMVARGDLGIEVPMEKIPGIQRMLIQKCMLRNRPVIVATQMLHSMIKNPRPTRAEISDIANAVFSHTDAVMLSGETAYGAYPREAVETMAKVCREAEAELDKLEYTIPVHFSRKSPNISTYLCKHAAIAQESLGVKAFITENHTGFASRMMASYRSKGPIYALCHDMKAVRSLALSHGVFPTYVQAANSHFLYMGLSHLIENGTLQKDDLLAYLFSTTDQGFSSLEINKAEKLLAEV
ncbi:MAG: pyruvate kinase [Bacteroidales bacterium]|nr:pyruvate kinase [Bacteroidales bacterium]